MSETVLPVASFPDLSLARPEVSHGHHLPRWEANGAIYHIALHLADSVPQTQLEIWRAERERLAGFLPSERVCRRDDGSTEGGSTGLNRTAAVSAADKAALKAVYNEHVEKYLNAGHGECLLRNEGAAAALADVLAHSNGKLYALHEWCIMPNHVHVVVGGFTKERPMREILQVWERASAHRINSVLGRKGQVWHRDAYTRIIRDREEYGHQINYVWNNPEVAGLTAGFRRERYV